jgi:hypothetical protein
MHTKKMVSAVVLAIFLCGARPFMAAQDANSTSKPAAQKPAVAYRLDFSINELENGKKLNSRHYSMNLTGGGNQDLKIGTRIPVQSEQGKFQYLDIGTYITARLVTWETPIVMDVNAEISSFAASNEGTASGPPPLTPPLIRQMRIGASTVVIPDKPMIIGSVDDPDSKRQFQLEVVATKLQ